MYGETLDRCRNRQQFYLTWYLPRNGSSKKFHETDHITRCNACWNLFHSAAAHKFHLKASKCNSGLINEIACCATCKKACVKPGLHIVVSGGFHFSCKARLPYSRLCHTCCPTGMTIWKQHRRTGRRGISHMSIKCDVYCRNPRDGCYFHQKDADKKTKPKDN